MRNKVKPLKDQLKGVRWGVLDYLAFIKWYVGDHFSKKLMFSKKMMFSNWNHFPYSQERDKDAHSPQSYLIYSWNS
jgi:hypothetical protein